MSVMQKTADGWKRCDSKNGIAMEIYDSNERMIGIYDGKPLYRKTFTGSTVLSFTAGQWLDTGINASGIEEYVNVFAIQTETHSRWNVDAATVNGHIGLNYWRNAQLAVWAICVEYTKTTDSPIDINRLDIISQNMYDGEEHQIGMWFGKPLYRKVFDYGNGSETTGSYIYKAHGISNIDNVVKLSGYIKFASGQFSALPFTSSTALNSQVSIVADASNVGYMSNASRTTDYFVFILEYTKTTD